MVYVKESRALEHSLRLSQTPRGEWSGVESPTNLERLYLSNFGPKVGSEGLGLRRSPPSRI